MATITTPDDYVLEAARLNAKADRVEARGLGMDWANDLREEAAWCLRVAAAVPCNPREVL